MLTLFFFSCTEETIYYNLEMEDSEFTLDDLDGLWEYNYKTYLVEKLTQDTLQKLHCIDTCRTVEIDAVNNRITGTCSCFLSVNKRCIFMDFERKQVVLSNCNGSGDIVDIKELSKNEFSLQYLVDLEDKYAIQMVDFRRR